MRYVYRRTYFMPIKPLMFLLLLPLLAHPATVYVDTKTPIRTIRQGLHLARSGDTVMVAAGTYYEYDLVVDKPLSLIGQPNSVIDGQSKGEILRIASGHVLVEGLTFQNVGTTSLEEWSGIKVKDVSRVVLRKNHFLNAFFAIYLSNSNRIEVLNNTLQGVASRTEASSGNGIHAWQCDSLLVRGNSVQGHRDGIYFEFVTNSKVINNTSVDNNRYGLHFMFSHADDYLGNTFSRNGSGVAVMYSKFVKMHDNIFEENWGSAAYGLLLKDISQGSMTHNIFRKNTVGVLMEGASELEIHHNQFVSNGWGLKIRADCEKNTVMHNNFIGNSFDVTTNGKTVLNTFARNYWDKYEGYDLNRDRFGDVPYHPVSLFGMIVEKMPFGLILLRSFMVGLLDRAEKIIPTLTPEDFVDQFPSIKPIAT